MKVQGRKGSGGSSEPTLRSFSYKYAVLEVAGEKGEEIRGVQWQEGDNYQLSVANQVSVQWQEGDNYQLSVANQVRITLSR